MLDILPVAAVDKDELPPTKESISTGTIWPFGVANNHLPAVFGSSHASYTDSAGALISRFASTLIRAEGFKLLLERSLRFKRPSVRRSTHTPIASLINRATLGGISRPQAPSFLDARLESC